jgi:amidase
MLSATAALRALALGDGTASQLLEAHVARIAQHNPRIRALVTLDIERARAAAQAVDALPLAERARRLAGEQPLLGLPISIKDAFATQGLRTTSSHPPLANYLPAADATLVARLKAAGAIVLGKSNLSELAGDPQCWSPLFGPTHNPWDLSLTPGGSSGGSAAAIAMGFAALELGSDIGGSIRIPAACCGVVGFKASENRLPRTGHIPHLPGQQRSVRHMLSFGLLARTVADVAHAMPSLAGADGEDQEVPPPITILKSELNSHVPSDSTFLYIASSNFCLNSKERLILFTPWAYVDNPSIKEGKKVLEPFAVIR